MYPGPNVSPSWEIPTNKPYSTWVFMGFFIPKNPKVEHNKYHGYTVRGTPNCPLTVTVANESLVWNQLLNM